MPTPWSPPAAGNGASPRAELPSLRFEVSDARALAHAAVPTISFALEIDAGGRAIRSILLDVQIQIAARGRGYSPAEQGRLLELFGTPERWGNTLRTLLWVRTSVIVPPFSASTRVEVPVTCTYDLEVSGARYLAALEHDAVPLEFLFSGSLFYAAEDGRLQTVRISWDEEATYRLPVAVWREAINRHFPGSAWLRLDREHFDRLSAYKAARALTSWEATLDALMASESEQL